MRNVARIFLPPSKVGVAVAPEPITVYLKKKLLAVADSGRCKLSVVCYGILL